MSNYHSHYWTCKAIEVTNKLYCACCRKTGINEVICSVSRDRSPIMEGASEAKILESVLKMLKPIKCSNYSEQLFTNSKITKPKFLTLKRMTPPELCNELNKRRKVTSGSKIRLQKRLERLLFTEILKNTLNQYPAWINFNISMINVPSFLTLRDICNSNCYSDVTVLKLH